MENHLRESQIEVVRAILTELKFSDKPRVLRELIDDIGLYVSVFDEPALRMFYEASVKAYTRSAPGGNMPKFADLLMELESLGCKNTNLWKQKYAERQNEKHNHVLAARLLMNYYLGKEVREFVGQWIDVLDKSKDVRDDIASLVTYLVNISSDGTQDPRPASILRKAREAGIREPQPTGFDALTRLLDGGWRQKSLVTFGAPSTHGKTSFGVSAMCERARQGRPTLFCSFEQPADELLFKAECNLSGVLTLEQVEHPDRISTQAEVDAFEYAESMLEKYVRIYDKACNPAEIAMRVRRHQAEYGPHMDFLEIDHIGAFGDIGSQSAAQRSNELTAYAKFVKQSICNEYGVCAVLFSQVSKELEDQLKSNNYATSDMLSNSRGIKMWTDVLMLGCRHNGKIKVNGEWGMDSSMRNVMVLQASKLRRGGVPLNDRIGLRYDSSHHRLMNEEVQIG